MGDFSNRVFTGGSDGKESVCNARDMGLIPGLGRSPGTEGNMTNLASMRRPPTSTERTPRLHSRAIKEAELNF